MKLKIVTDGKYHKLVDCATGEPVRHVESAVVSWENDLEPISEGRTVVSYRSKKVTSYAEIVITGIEVEHVKNFRGYAGERIGQRLKGEAR